LRLISPRTNELLHIKPRRLRHTGATLLAMRGVSRDLIAEILEHDSTESAQAYIDAVASELAPQLEKADRNMGNMFHHLNHAFFNGKIIDEMPSKPIIIPIKTDTPLIVGSCGKNTIKDGKCDRHPFLGCYNGCSNFLAWREQDHRKALIYVEQEIERWKEASGHADQEALLMEYREVEEAICEVIERIEEEAANAD